MVFVLPDGNYDSWYIDSPNLKYETFIAKELTGFIQKNYHSDQSKTALMGWSMMGMAHCILVGDIRISSVLSEAYAVSLILFLLDYPLDTPIEKEISWAFDNFTFMLNSVGLDWSNVAHVNSYHVPETDGYISAGITEVVHQLGIRMLDHKPVWTSLGVAAIGNPRMRVEIWVTTFRGIGDSLPQPND